MLVLSLQYLRGLAAFMVLMEHVAIKSAQQSTDALSGWHVGGAGVDLFFIISGFIMCHTTAHKHQTSGASRQFFMRRILRIIPLYWLVTCLALLVYLIMPSQVNGGGGTAILQSYLLLPSEHPYLVANGWTLRFEFLFYLIFMLGFLLSSRLGHALVCAILFAMVAIGFWKPQTGVWGEFLTSVVLVEFVFGILLYYAFTWLQRQSIMLHVTLIGIGIGALLAVNQGAHSTIRAIDFGVPMFLLMAGFLGLEKVLQAQPITVFKMLGDSSYAMYLIHPFALAGSALVLSKLGLSHLFGGWLFIAVLTLVSILAGYVVYQWIEVPIANRLKRFSWSRRATQNEPKQPLRGSI